MSESAKEAFRWEYRIGGLQETVNYLNELEENGVDRVEITISDSTLGAVIVIARRRVKEATEEEASE